MKRPIPGVVVASITWLVLLLLSIAFAYDKQSSAYSFGFEYGNIAASMVEGRGYAHVFENTAGASAWMLPVNTSIYAVIFAVFGVKSFAAMWACIVTSCILWSLCAYYLYQSGRLFSETLAIIAVLALVCLLLLHRTIIVSLFDYALINFLTIATVYYLYCYLHHSTHYRALLVLAVVLPLASPGLFLAFALILMIRFGYLLVRRTRLPSGWYAFFRSGYSKIVYLGLASVVVMLLWGFRNYQALGKFIPSKSNFWYEFYQANMADDDGIINSRTFRTFHPSAEGKYRNLYDSLGEIGFLDYMEQQSKEEFLLPDYLQRVGRRAQFALVNSENTNLKYPADTASFPPQDEAILHREGLVQGGEWIALDMDSTALMNTIEQLPLNQKATIASDWIVKKALYTQKAAGLGSFIRETSVSLVPFLCIVLGFFIKSIRMSSLFQLTITTYFIQLLPYILASHYIRYQYYVLALQALLLFMIATYFINRASKAVSPVLHTR